MAIGVRSMVRLAARGTSWSHFVDYASPALFDVMPARTLMTQCREFIRNGGDKERFDRIRESTGAVLQARAIEVQLTDRSAQAGGTELGTQSESVRRETGQRILELYFAQLFGTDHAILDLRSDSFLANDSGPLLWRPKAFYVEWQSEFIEAVRDLYIGYYYDDPERFNDAMARLDMQSGEDTLRALLGKDDPRSSRFETAAFHENFHEVFVTYRDQGVALHRNFLGLGVYLVCLYEALEAVGVALDVRAALDRARG